MMNTCFELGGREQNAVSPRTVLPILGTAQPLNSGGRLVRHLSVSRKLRSIGKCFSLWCRWYTGNSALRGQPRCGAPTALTLTYLPIAVPSWEDLGENSYEWLPEWVTSSEFCDNLFSPFSISLALGRKQKRPERKTYRSGLVGSHPFGRWRLEPMICECECEYPNLSDAKHHQGNPFDNKGRNNF